MDEAKETAETKGELSREDVRRASCKACKTYEMAHSCRLAAERVARHTYEATPEAMRSGGLASVGDLANQRQKEKGKAEHRNALLSTIVLIVIY